MQQAESVRKQLTSMMKRKNIPLVSRAFESRDYYPEIRRCVVAGMFMKVAHLERTGQYLTVKDNQLVSIHPSSVLDTKPAWVCFEEFSLTTKQFIRTCTGVRVEWLLDIAPHYYDLENFPDGEAKYDIEQALRRVAAAAKRKS